MHDRQSFPDCEGEAARIVQEFDWSSTTLGPVSDWPAGMRAVVSMILRSTVPTVTLWGETGVMVYNDGYASFASSRHPAMMGMDVRAAWPEAADFNANVLSEVLGKGVTLSYRATELLLIRNGAPERCWFDLDYSPIVDDDGRRVGIIAFVMDTTTKVLADRRLQDEQRRLQQMFDQSPSFMAMLEGPEHRFAHVNDAYKSLVGDRDLLGLTVAQALPEAAAQGYLRLLDDAFRTGKAFRSSRSPFDALQDDGSFRRYYVDFVYQPLTGDDGEVKGIFVDGVDVTPGVLAEEASKRNQLQFETFAQSLPNHVWTAPASGLLDWFNDRVLEYSGRPSSVLAGDGWTDLVHTDDLSDAARQWSEAIRTGSRYETEFRIRRSDGVYRWHLVRALPILADDGVIERWIGTNTDIHEQKLAEQETSRDRDRLWALSQDLMLVCDYDGLITAVNPSAHRLLGWQVEEMVGRPLSDFVHPDDLPATQHEVAGLSRGATTLKFENRYRSSTGDYRLLEWTAVPDNGRIHAVGRDLTEERRLARDRERVWNLSPVLKVVADLRGQVSAINPSWTQTLGWTTNETVGRFITDFMPEEQHAWVARALLRLAEGETLSASENEVLTKQGERRRIAWTVVPDGGSVYAFGRDITAETEAAEALRQSEAALRQAQKMEAIGQLTGGIAHDFNNLLQVISGNLQLLAGHLQGSGKPETRLKNAMEGVTRGARLASQLLSYGRRQPLAPKVVNLGKLVRGMDEMLRRALGEAIEIEVVVAGGLWNTLVDPGNVENALLNLAINARDAMDGDGKLTIEAGNSYLDDRYSRFHADVVPGQYVVVSVTDTGSGMPPEIIEKVFDPFFSTKPEGKGTGLGLSMVHGFVKQSGGHVKIYSEPGEGTTVKLYLPRSVEAEDDFDREQPDRAVGGAETILVVEDDAGVRQTVVETLSELGYSVVQAPDPDSALAIVESGMRLDLLFTDVVMPGRLKSSELARKAKLRFPDLKVLYTSGYTENSIVHAGRLDPGVNLLGKPYTREDLSRRIRSLLDKG